MGLRQVAFFAAAAAVVAVFAAGAVAGGRAQASLSLFVTGSGVITGPGINCGNGNNDCSETYTAGVGVTLTETPAGGATFSGWGGPCSGTATTCTFTINANTTATAAFGTGTRTLTLDVNGSGVVTAPGINCGSGNTDCSETYATNTSVTLTATPLGGATFTGWGGACSGNASTCTFAMTTDKGVTAVFAGGGSAATLTVTSTGSGRVTGPGISCGLGNTDCSETYATNATVQLAATPAAGATFTGWGGACSGNASTCTVTMSAARSVTATFSASTVRPTLTVTVSGAGIVTGPGIACGLGNTDCSESYAAGAVVPLTASAASGATFLGWAQTSPLIVGFCGGGTLATPPRTCNVTMDVSKAVVARFGSSTLPPAPTGGFDVHKIGDPIVFTTPNLKQASFRFFTNRAASAVMSTVLNGSTVSAFRFSPHAGDVLVGPFLLTSPGNYVFHLTLTDAAGTTEALDWALTGPGQFRPLGVFVNRGVTATRTGSGWAVHVRFTAPAAGVGSIRMTWAGRTVSQGTIRFSKGIVVVTLPARRAGLHRVTLNAHTARRAQTLTWAVLLS